MNDNGQCGDNRKSSKKLNWQQKINDNEMKMQNQRCTYYRVDVPYLLKQKGEGIIKIDHVSCGNLHTVILTTDNRILTMGNNTYYQCSTFNVSENILSPFWLRKESELGIAEESVCSWILALNYGTLIAINGS